MLDFSSPGWLLATQARTQGLFRWCDLLHEALNGTDVQILIHSTWRRRCSDRVLADLLGQDLAPRVIVADYWVSPNDRLNLSHAAYIDQVLKAWQQDRTHFTENAEDPAFHEASSEALTVSVLDDRPNLFKEDHHLLDAYSPVMIWTNPDLGISEKAVQERVAQWAKAAPGRCQDLDAVGDDACQERACSPAPSA